MKYKRNVYKNGLQWNRMRSAPSQSERPYESLSGEKEHCHRTKRNFRKTYKKKLSVWITHAYTENRWRSGCIHAFQISSDKRHKTANRNRKKRPERPRGNRRVQNSKADLPVGGRGATEPAAERSPRSRRRSLRPRLRKARAGATPQTPPPPPAGGRRRRCADGNTCWDTWNDHVLARAEGYFRGLHARSGTPNRGLAPLLFLAGAPNVCVIAENSVRNPLTWFFSHLFIAGAWRARTMAGPLNGHASGRALRLKLAHSEASHFEFFMRSFSSQKSLIHFTYKYFTRTLKVHAHLT